MVNAVCGAGKTEIVIGIINYYLQRQKRIGFIIPRVEIVCQIYQRLKTIFATKKVVAIFGYKKAQLADIIVMTCHKAINYVKKLDLVIIDEVDAYPLSHNSALQKLCFNLTLEKTIYLSATPPPYLSNNLKVLTINQRFHQGKIPTPQVVLTINFKLALKKILQTNQIKFFVYFPTISMQMEYYHYFKNNFNIYIINSQTKQNQAKLKHFSKSQDIVIFTTLTLERGLTYHMLNVIVVDANHNLFSVANLIQITGRVGRTKSFQKGKVYLLSKSWSIKIKKLISYVNEKN